MIFLLMENADDLYGQYPRAVFRRRKDVKAAVKYLNKNDPAHGKGWWGVRELPYFETADDLDGLLER